MSRPSSSTSHSGDDRPDIYVVSIDLGKESDPTALVVDKIYRERPLRHVLVHLARWELRTHYRVVADTTKALLDHAALAAGDTHLILDVTGVGLGVIELFEERGMEPVGILITAGWVSAFKDGHWNVPKRNLVAAMQVVMQNRRLKLSPSLEGADVLQKEMENFTRKTDRNKEVFEAWRDSDHDDMVLATAQAIWYGNHTFRDEVDTTDDAARKPMRPTSRLMCGPELPGQSRSRR